ncbi:NUDIX domain-containing protein [Blastococcus saxobsidens]|uniref:Putative NTP pyrophosphohydrolase n=1 Tax=Blastococcus saxobsidens (strain DD2) TaxID=1146883 RepID=H6RWF8_BLASD|nr:NUDIX hydrolase [Blastococcus saxobsidens]CCG03373.1 putative NTP pyrophosphohydrolase [Blastococcus saxobsidens DD2]
MSTDGHDYRVLGSETVYEGPIISLYRDTVAMPGGNESTRDVVRHVGAVAVVALDDQGNVVLLRQYRHPVGGYLWELPAGLRDTDGEPPLETAKRELAEEVQLAAQRWSLLTTHYSSPGFCDEMVLVYLAEELTDVSRPDGFTVEHEEADLTVERVPLADAVQRVFDGGIRNVAAVVGVLAAAQARTASPRLRPVDAG